MSILDSLRKGFRFFLMSFGVSSTSKKTGLGSQATKQPPTKPRS